MRKHLKRTLSMLLVLAMVLTMLPTLVMAASEESFVATPLPELPAAGEAVVIYSASAGGVFAGYADGGSVGRQRDAG